MNPGKNFQQFERKPDGERNSASLRWVLALKNVLTGNSPSRRSRVVGSSLTEALEVRRVLSAANPIQPMTLESSQLSAVDAAVRDSANHDFLIDLQAQFAAALAMSGVSTESDLEPFGGNHFLSAFENGQISPSMTPMFDTSGVFVNSPEPGIALSVTVHFAWNSGPPGLDVTKAFELDLQITLHGLGSSPLATVDRATAEELLKDTATTAIQSYQPSRRLLISFQNSNSVQWEPVYQQNQAQSSIVPGQVPGIEVPDSTSEGTVPWFSADESNPPLETSIVEVDPISLIDEVFNDTTAILDGPSLLPPIMAEAGGLTFAPQADSKIENLSEPVYSQSPANLFATLSIDAAPPNFVANEQEHDRSGTVFRSDWRGHYPLHLPGVGLINSNGLSDSEEQTGSPLQNFSIVVGVSAWPEKVETPEPWITWLSGSGLVTESNSDHAVLHNALAARSVPESDLTQVQRSQSRTKSDVTLASSAVPSTPHRRLRASMCQSSSAGGLEWPLSDEFEPPEMFRRDSVPVQLKYAVSPRGPPVYGQDADIPLVDPEAPANLLERLRYSIAPRGPSLVTVEMQSPEFPSFSGPRVSPEELHFTLAC